MKSAETITQWDDFRRRLTKQFCTTGTQGISRTILSWQCLGTDNHSSTWWKILGSRDQKQPSTKALSKTITTSVFLILEVLCFIISAPRPYRKVPKASAPGCYSLFQECSSSLRAYMIIPDQSSTQQGFILWVLVTWCHVSHPSELCFSQEENRSFKAHQPLRSLMTQECHLEQLVRGLFFDTEMGLVTVNQGWLLCNGLEPNNGTVLVKKKKVYLSISIFGVF